MTDIKNMHLTKDDLFLAEANLRIKIRQENILPHLDVEKYLSFKKDGNATFTLRVNKGQIVDFVPTEYIDVVKKYFTTPYSVDTSDQEKNINPDNVMFHIILENEVETLEFGSITVSATIKNGKIITPKLNIVINKRWRYLRGLRDSGETLK